MDVGILNWQAHEVVMARNAFLAQSQYLHRAIVFCKFAGFVIEGTGDDLIRTPSFKKRREHVWLSQIKVFDTVKGGYFTTGDLDVNSIFQIRGYNPGFTLPDGTAIEEYVSDHIIWNGKLWTVADQIEPVQVGYLGTTIFWRTTLRRSDRTGVGLTAGPS